MPPPRSIVLLALAVVLVRPVVAQSPPNDPWHSAPESSTRFWSAPRLPQAKIAEVPTSNLAAALSQLRDLPILEVSAKEASSLLNRSFSVAPGEHLFLVRALVTINGGTFVVIPLGHELLIDYGVLSKVNAPMARRALVVSLPIEPARVYVTCSVAS